MDQLKRYINERLERDILIDWLCEAETGFTQAKIEALERSLSREANSPVVIMYRDEKEFSASTHVVKENLPAMIKQYFGNAIVFDQEPEHDNETGSKVYFKIR